MSLTRLWEFDEKMSKRFKMILVVLVSIVYVVDFFVLLVVVHKKDEEIALT